MRLRLVLEQTLAPVPGGTGRYARELARALATSAGPDDQVGSVVAWHRDVSAARLPAVDGPHRLAAPGRVLSRLWQRGLPPRVTGADVVHAPTLLLPPTKAALVVSIHDAVPWTHPETLTPRGVRWHRAMALRAAEHAGAITVLTHAAGREILASVPELRAEQIVHLGAGVSQRLLEDPTPERIAEVSHRLGLPERFVLSTATVEPRKGLDVLVEALALLGGRAPDLVVTGQPGWGGVDVGQLARAARLDEAKVHVLGRVSDDDLAIVLRRATALAMPSRSEGFGLPIAEAMSVGTPVVCSDVAAMVEVAGGAAEVVPVADPDALATALARIDEDPVKRASMAAAGREVARQHTWDAVAARAWQLYRRLG